LRETRFYKNGNEALLDNSPIAVFCSREIPLSIYHTANEIFIELLKLPVTVAGGWQSAMEKRVLKNYGSGSQAGIIYFLAKGINKFHIPEHLKHLMDTERLLTISPFLDEKRIEKRFVAIRDELILNLAKRLFFLYINPEGSLKNIFYRCVSEGREVYLLEHQANSPYFRDGVKPINLKNIRDVLLTRHSGRP
jgi:predicted Rossmann fold nucleotide-binding protein DprA/Smf involved in DNA uptake